MPAYFELRERLADAYPSFTDWQRIATDSGAAVGEIVFQGSAIGVWSNILTAVRLQQRLPGLREVLAKEHPDLLDVFDQYAADVARGLGNVADLPALRNIVLPPVPVDLNADKISRSLDFEQVLPIDLLIMSLAAGQPNLDAADTLISGVNTKAANARRAQFHSEQERATAPLQTRQDEVANKLGMLKQRMASIRSAQRPLVPTLQDLASVPNAQKAFWEEQNRKEMEEYRAALIRYETDQNTLSALDQDNDAARRELANLEAAIASQRAQALAQEPIFDQDIGRARDQDLQIKLDQLTQAATTALLIEANPFKSLWTLLATSCLLDLFANLAEESRVATEASLRFHEAAEALVEPIQEGLSAIAQGCLAAPTLVYRSLEKNREAANALSARLSQLPLPQLETGRQRASALLGGPLGSIPQFDTLEQADELEGVRRWLVEQRQTTVRHISALCSEINAEPAELRETIHHAQMDVKTTIEAIADRAAKTTDALGKTTLLWSLINRGRASANLPDFMRKLCETLRQEFIRRVNTSVDAVLGEALTSEFGLKSLQMLIDNHLLTSYERDRDQLQVRLTECRQKLNQITAAFPKIDERYEQVARHYRTQLVMVTTLSLIPGLGLVASLWASSLVRRLDAIVASDQPLYTRLGQFATRSFTWAVAGAAVSSAATTVITFLFYSGNFLDLGVGTAAVAFTVTCYLALTVAIRNLLAAMAQVRAHKSLGGATAPANVGGTQ